MHYHIKSRQTFTYGKKNDIFTIRELLLGTANELFFFNMKGTTDSKVVTFWCVNLPVVILTDVDWWQCSALLLALISPPATHGQTHLNHRQLGHHLPYLCGSNKIDVKNMGDIMESRFKSISKVCVLQIICKKNFLQVLHTRVNSG